MGSQSFLLGGAKILIQSNTPVHLLPLRCTLDAIHSLVFFTLVQVVTASTGSCNISFTIQHLGPQHSHSQALCVFGSWMREIFPFLLSTQDQGLFLANKNNTQECLLFHFSIVNWPTQLKQSFWDSCPLFELEDMEFFFQVRLSSLISGTTRTAQYQYTRLHI